jgi:hypothetical protein
MNENPTLNRNDAVYIHFCKEIKEKLDELEQLRRTAAISKTYIQIYGTKVDWMWHDEMVEPQLNYTLKNKPHVPAKRSKKGKTKKW